MTKPSLFNNLATRASPLSARRIPCLDGLRAFSILLVFIDHAARSAHLTGKWSSVISRTLFPYGNKGVTIFFVISGYLITHLLVSEWGRTRKIELLQFYRRRVLRIFPAFYSYILVITLLCFLGFMSVPPVRILAAATFTANVYRDAQPAAAAVGESNESGYVEHFWSLAYEEQFYLIWPTILILLTPRRAIVFPLVWIMFAPLVRLATHWPLPPLEQNLPEFYKYFDFLMIGSLAALCQGEAWFESFMKRLHGGIPAACAFFSLTVAPFIRHLGFHHRIPLVYELTIEPEVDAACIVVVLLWLVRHAESTVGRFLERPLIVHVGVMSYSLYVWQQLFLTEGNRSWVGQFPLNILFAIAAAEISYRCIEEHFRRPKRITSPEMVKLPAAVPD